MAEIVRMPKMSDTMTEGVVAKWHKKVGDTIKSGELMAEIETDKATMDYESFNAGTVLYLGVQEGQAVTVNGVLAIVGNPGEDYKGLLEGAGARLLVLVDLKLPSLKPKRKEINPSRLQRKQQRLRLSILRGSKQRSC